MLIWLLLVGSIAASPTGKGNIVTGVAFAPTPYRTQADCMSTADEIMKIGNVDAVCVPSQILVNPVP